MNKPDDYADPKLPRTVLSKLLLVVLVLMAVGGVAAAAWVVFLRVTGVCSKYG